MDKTLTSKQRESAKKIAKEFYERIRKKYEHAIPPPSFAISPERNIRLGYMKTSKGRMVLGFGFEIPYADYMTTSYSNWNIIDTTGEVIPNEKYDDEEKALTQNELNSRIGEEIYEKFRYLKR